MVRGPGGVLELSQRSVALETLGESGSSLGAKAVSPDPASMGAEAGAEACQRALTQKRTLGGGGALERGHGAPLEPLAQLGDALGGVGAGGVGAVGVGAVAAIVDAAELVVAQAAKGRRSVNGR